MQDNNLLAGIVQLSVLFKAWAVQVGYFFFRRGHAVMLSGVSHKHVHLASALH